MDCGMVWKWIYAMDRLAMEVKVTLSCCPVTVSGTKGFQPMFCTGRAYLEA